MPILDILKFPDPVLRKKCEEVKRVDAQIQKLLDDMADTMYDAPGVGLAAPQVGITKRVIVVDVSLKSEDEDELLEDRSHLIKLVNPEIIYSEGEELGEEGCLSIPGFTSDVRRSAVVGVSALNDQGDKTELEAEGLLARVIQHEIDHLDGVLFIDRLSRLKRELLKRKIEKVLGKEVKYAVM